jgi:hypothetical protein
VKLFRELVPWFIRPIGVPHPPGLKGPFSAALSGGGAASVQGQPGGDGPQPLVDRLAPGDDSGLAGQDQESGLEDVLGVVLVAQDAPANGQDHAPVAAHQGLKGGLFTPADEAFQQLPVGRFPGRPPAGRFGGMAEGQDGLPVGHFSHAPGRLLLYPIMPGERAGKCMDYQKV